MTEISLEEKIKALEDKLTVYKEKLANEMKGYRGVIHESAASEIKHDKVMVLRAMISQIELELINLKKKLQV